MDPAPSTAPSLSSRATAPASFHVTSDAWLFRHIASFLEGIPVELYQFWTRHDPKPPRGAVTYDMIARLANLVVKAGTPRHLDLISSSRFFRDGKWHEPTFGWLARTAIEKQRVDLLQWMVEKNLQLTKPRALWRAAIQKYVGDSSLKGLELLEKACPLTESDAQQQIPSAISNPAAPLLRWISTHYPSVDFPVGLTEAAAKNRDLEGLRLLLGHPQSRGCGISAFVVAYESGYHDVLEFLVANCADTMTDDFGADLVTDEAVPIQEIVSRYPSVFEPISRKAFLNAVRSGDDDKMQALFAMRTTGSSETVSIDEATSWNGLTGLKLLHERGIAHATTEAMDAAAEGKRWDVVEYLRVNRAEGYTIRAVNAAVRSGEIKWVRTLLEKRPEGSRTNVMNLAAESGSMEILRYIHHHTQIGCTTEAMDAAATQGHIRVVKFLHKERHEGCTANAIDGASRGGFFDVVQYLCENRSEGCTKAAVQGALENHYLEVVDLQYKHFPHLFDSELLFDLLLRGAFVIFMKLRDAFPEEAGGLMETVMFEAGKQFELRTIRFIVNVLGRSDLLQFALEGAEWLEGEQGRLWRGVVSSISTSTSPLSNTVTGSSLPNSLGHPFLSDVRTPTWAIRAVLTETCTTINSLGRCLVSVPWQIRAVNRRDLELLRVIRDLPPATFKRCAANPFRIHSEPFSLRGARAEAIRMGDQHTLEWLLANTALPVEKTLLGEAVYYHQYEIAEWLLVNRPEACTELDWTNKGNETDLRNFGLQDGLLDWLESHEAVRNALPFNAIVDFAARKNDVESLTRLYECYPELFTPRPSLIELADLEECSDAINFLLEIGWSADVFFEGS